MKSNLSMRFLLNVVLLCFAFQPNDIVVGRPVTLVDLSYDLTNETPAFPGLPGFQLNKLPSIILGGTTFALNEFSSTEHIGTHMDAPFHTNETKWTIDQIPIDHFTFPAAVIDISKQASENPDTQIQMKDIETWEQQNGLIPNGSVVFMHSGWGKNWLNRTAFLGGPSSNDLHFPGFQAEVCKWLVVKRSIFGIGVDVISGDPGNTKVFKCHETMFDHNLFILENVANLDKLPPVGATVRAYPMKIRNGTGAPTRIIASIV